MLAADSRQGGDKVVRKILLPVLAVIRVIAYIEYSSGRQLNLARNLVQGTATMSSVRQLVVKRLEVTEAPFNRPLEFSLVHSDVIIHYILGDTAPTYRHSESSCEHVKQAR